MRLYRHCRRGGRHTARGLVHHRFSVIKRRRRSKCRTEYSIVIAERGLVARDGASAQESEGGRIAFEAEHTSVATFQEIESLIKPAQAVASTRIVEDLRLRKG
jgi:hypothetical protein